MPFSPQNMYVFILCAYNHHMNLALANYSNSQYLMNKCRQSPMWNEEDMHEMKTKRKEETQKNEEEFV